MDNLGTISLFENESEIGKQRNKLSVAKLEFLDSQNMTWQELFDGFDTMYAITFSSGINFIYELLEKFKTAEVIFGCENAMSYTLNEIMAFQGKVIERLRNKVSSKKDELLERIDNGEIHFLVVNKKISHEKIYILKSKDGRKRVIMGSANMSYNAFNGMQRENICYIDGETAYNYYYNLYLDLKTDSTDEITHACFVNANLEDCIDELPISNTIKTKNVMVLTPEEDKEEVEFVLEVNKNAKYISSNLPSLDKSNKKTIITPEKITELKHRTVSNAVKEKDLRKEYPQLNIDIENNRVTLNDEILNLQPKNDEIANDVKYFIKYMEGYSSFHGDYKDMQNRYYEFANWFFCTPFMAKMRDTAARFDKGRFPYPVYGLIYGKSKAGKTSFLETLLKMMIGQKPKVSAPEFTASGINDLKHRVCGAPIIVDDLTNTRFNQHAIETIKNEDFGIEEHLTNYPAVVISANEDVKAVAQEIIRRTVICHVEAGLTNTEIMKSNIVRMVQKNIGTAFYREYLRRMLIEMPALIDNLKNDTFENSPDILSVSSNTILGIISDYCENVPEYIRTLTFDNYFSEKVTGKNAIKTIQNTWKVNKKAFEIKRRENKLVIDFGENYEAARIVKELPETLEPKQVQSKIVMKLDKSKEFFGVKFKKSILK